MGSGALTIRGTALAFAASCSLASGRAVYDVTRGPAQTETLARLLVVWIFTDAALRHQQCA
jgi:hypothetical protein